MSLLNYNSFIEQAINIQNNIEDLQPLGGKSVFVFPFQIVSGQTILTENGEKDNSYDPEDFTSYFSVLDGKSSAIAIWEDSTFATDSDNPTDPWYWGNYKVGNWYRGYIESDGASSGIGSLNGLDGYTAFKPAKNFVISFGKDADEVNLEDVKYETYWDVPTKDLLKLYVIPEIFGNQWLKIDNVNKMYDASGNLVRVSVSFSSVSDALSSTAGTKVSMVQPSASGEGYAWPKVVAAFTEDNGVEVPKKIELEPRRLQPKPITSQQVKYNGVAALNTIIAMGRPIRRSELDITLENDNTTFKKKITPSQLLLPSRTIASYNEKLSFVSKPVDNFYVVSRAQSTFKTYYQEWREEIKVLYDPTAVANYEGVLECGGKSAEFQDEIKATNPLLGDKYQHSLKDNPAVKVCKTNVFYPTQATGACDTQISFFADNKYTYADILSHNFFITSPMVSMPQGANSTTTWSLASIPVVGGFLNALTLGSNIGFQINTTKIPTPSIPLLIPADIFDLQLGTQGGTKFQWNLPYDLFRFGKADQLGALAGYGNFNTTIRTLLTHKFTKDGVVKNTLLLGQKVSSDQSIIPELKWSSGCAPIAYTNPIAQDEEDLNDPVVGYIIDSHLNKAVFEGTYTLTYLGGEIGNSLPEPINDFKLISKSSTTNSIREWTNIYHTSFWRKDFNVSLTKQWPEAILLPIKNQDILVDVSVPTENVEQIKKATFYVPHINSWRDFNSRSELENFMSSVNLTFFHPKMAKSPQVVQGGEWSTNRLTMEMVDIFTQRVFFNVWYQRYASIANPDDKNSSLNVLKSVNNSILETQKLNSYADLFTQFREFKFVVKAENAGVYNYQNANVYSTMTDKFEFSISSNDLKEMYSSSSTKKLDIPLIWTTGIQQIATLYVPIVPYTINTSESCYVLLEDVKFVGEDLTFKFSSLVSWGTVNKADSHARIGGARNITMKVESIYCEK